MPPLREASLADHLSHIEKTIDRILLAAALKDCNDFFTGSIMIVDASSEESALPSLGWA